MNAAAENGHLERERFLAEIAELKRQRDQLIRQLAACKRENTKLRSRLSDGGDK